MACNAEDCGLQKLNNDEIGTSVQEKFDPVNDETDEDECQVSYTAWIAFGFRLSKQSRIRTIVKLFPSASAPFFGDTLCNNIVKNTQGEQYYKAITFYSFVRTGKL
ncbi:hypothetical protein TNCV_4482421 [Trichonephila clavipes]|nr:hypothetical protein TNCV_4482421 [Trichonephila clavipes]